MGVLHRIGWITLAVGIVLLVGGLICAMTIGTLAVPILLSSSILVNSVAITMLRSQKTGEGRGRKK